MHSSTDRSTNRPDHKGAIERLERLFLLDDAPPARPAETAQPPASSFWVGVGITSILAMSIYLVGQKAPEIEKVWKQATASVSSTVQTVMPPQVTNGLSATRTTLTGVVDPESMTAAYYLSTILKNSSSTNQEAQMRITLPAGAAVTRATLWINGQAQEAAFTDRNSAQQAFDWVVQGRRDPLLVKQIDARTVEVIGNPVMPGGDGMKIRIGITAPLRLMSTGEVSAELPQIESRNFADGSYDVHLESGNAIISEGADVARSGHNNVLRLHKQSVRADIPQLTFARHMGPTTFATRATHSLNGGYIVATIKSDAQTHETRLSLRKQSQKPGADIPIIKSKDAAARLSTLWAKGEIEQFTQEGDQGSAVALAHVYRVVSPVSSAVVLEQQSDYDRFGLNRNQWESMGANKHSVSARRSARDKSIARPAMEAPMPTASPAPGSRATRITDIEFAPQSMPGGSVQGFMPDEGAADDRIAQAPVPMLKGATNGSVGPAAAAPAPDGDATQISGVDVAGTVRVAAQNPATVFGGLLIASLLGVLGYAPAAILAVRGTRRSLRRQAGAEKLLLLCAGWLVLATFLPVVSQILAAAMAVILLARKRR